MIVRFPYSYDVADRFLQRDLVEALVGSTLKVRRPEAKTLIDKIKAEIKKRAELKVEGATDASEGTQKEAEALAARRDILG